ncbi:MAG: hypothetical protein A2176_09280 [Spirochaetes bacterium RBG_13_51_14]|nr:MAG: hypothetical protein A2176_09280 [Spirochaetes bacterium RBG_13_51_14]
MKDEINAIIEKAKELSSLIRNHDTAQQYRDCRELMRNDRKAQELYAKLVELGKELNAVADAGGTFETQPSSEHDLLQRELDRNPLVKDYIRCQKEYLELLKKVIDKIKNPSL